MANLNLLPNPAVLAFQSAVFLANLVVVKKFFLNPYLKIRDRKFAATYGAQEVAQRYLGENEKIVSALEVKLDSSRTIIRDETQKMLDQAKAQRDHLIKNAEQASKSYLDETIKGLVSDFNAEKAKVPDLVKNIVPGLYQHLLT
jgi:F0F1-type ATP synthase membrane subunit b/b'